MISAREQKILELLVREYIRSAEPVSSECIAGRLHGSLSPATIRNVFADLTEEGYIEQHHISGGRVPKTPAYRFFVDSLISEDENSADFQLFEPLMEAMDEDMRRFQEMIARRFRVLAYLAGSSPVGFKDVLGEPEFEEPDYLRELAMFLDTIDKYERVFDKRLADDRMFKVIIGEENDIQPMNHISIVLTRLAEGSLFCMAGPTRMHYDEIINMMKLWKTKEKRKKTKN